MIYLASDWHFCHDAEFVWKARGFKDIEDMNHAIVQRHNAFVSDSDDVYFLGDAMLDNNEHAMEFIRQLHGKFHWIIGNHDSEQRLALLTTISNSVMEGYATQIDIHDVKLYLSHYPTITMREVDALKSARAYNAAGHTHYQCEFDPLSPLTYNVAMDAHNCYPVSVEQVIRAISIRRHLFLKNLSDC